MYSLPQSYNQTSKCKRCISSNAYFDTSKVIDLKPCYSYTLTIKPNKTDIPGGKVGLDITVVDDVTNEDVTVNIPGDYIPN